MTDLSIRNVLLSATVFAFLIGFLFYFWAASPAGTTSATQPNPVAQQAKFPDLTKYMSWNYALNQVPWNGTNFSFQIFNLGPVISFTWFTQGIAYFVAVFIFLGDLFYAVALFFGWLFTAGTLWVNFLPYPMNLMIEGLIGMVIGGSAITSLFIFRGR